MADFNATCALSITAETLSAWRDKQVKATTAAELARHVPTCAACQRELTQFEMVARALHRQRELAPGNRIWRGVQTQIAGHRHPGMRSNSRAIFSGISGVIIVVLLGFVFARVLGGLDKNTGPTATATTTTQATATPSPVPTATGSPTASQVTTIAQAWGANAAKQTLTTPSDATHVFQAQNITRDGKKLLGNQLTLSNSQGTLYASNERASFLDTATHQITDLGLLAPAQGMLDTPSRFMTDSQFIAVEDNSQPGATGSVLHDRFWSYDLQAPQTAHLVATGEQFQGVTGGALDHGVLVVNTGTGLQLEDLAKQTYVTLVPPGGSQASVILVAFTWPYLLYDDIIVTASGEATALYMHNMTTNTADAPFLPGTTIGSSGSVAITGDTLFYATSDGTFELDHFTTPGAQPRLLTTYTGSLIGANARLVLFGGAGTGTSAVAWDRTEHKLVQLVAQGETNIPQVALSGDYLLVIQPFTNSSAQQVAIYDTTTLPGS